METAMDVHRRAARLPSAQTTLVAVFSVRFDVRDPIEDVRCVPMEKARLVRILTVRADDQCAGATQQSANVADAYMYGHRTDGDDYMGFHAVENYRDCPPVVIDLSLPLLEPLKAVWMTMSYDDTIGQVTDSMHVLWRTHMEKDRLMQHLLWVWLENDFRAAIRARGKGRAAVLFLHPDELYVAVLTTIDREMRVTVGDERCPRCVRRYFTKTMAEDGSSPAAVHNRWELEDDGKCMQLSLDQDQVDSLNQSLALKPDEYSTEFLDARRRLKAHQTRGYGCDNHQMARPRRTCKGLRHALIASRRREPSDCGTYGA